MPAVSDVVDVLPKVKAMCLADRAMFDRAMRAFVSYVQAYAKHECSLIFRVKGTRRKRKSLDLTFMNQWLKHPVLFSVQTDLDFASLARGFALLRLPKMPELRGKTFPEFAETTVDTNTIRYKDKNREKQRQKMLAELKDKTSAPKKHVPRNAAWSKQKNKKDRRKKRVAKRKHDEVYQSS